MFTRLKKILVSLRDFYLVKVKWRKYTFGKNFHAGRNVVLWAKESIPIGDNCYIGRNSQIECNVKIGDDVLIANNVAFVGRYDHHYQQIGTPIRLASQVRDSDYSWLEIGRKTVVKKDVWIGYGVTILSGVTLGRGSIVAAGSIVNKDVEPYSIYAGCPAKKVANRFNDSEDIRKHEKLYL